MVGSGCSDVYNRQLHPDEQKIIHDLAHGDAAEEHRLEAAGCALVHCAAQYAPGTADYAQYSALEQEGVGYTKEQGELQGYVTTSFSAATYGGMARQTTGSLFQYTQGDSDADQKASRSGMEAQRRGSIDYLTVQGGAGFGGLLASIFTTEMCTRAGPFQRLERKVPESLWVLFQPTLGKRALSRRIRQIAFLKGNRWVEMRAHLVFAVV